MKTALSMIVRNEERNLPACLDSVRGLFDETVIVDTGSTDRTVKIAKRFGRACTTSNGATTSPRPGTTGSTGPRPITCSAWTPTTGFHPSTGSASRDILDGLDDVGPTVYMFRVVSIQHTGDRAFSDESRLWPHCDAIRFVGRVHERIQPEKVRGITPTDLRGITHRKADVRIEHSGYQTEAEYFGKLRRNIAILEEMVREPVFDPIVLFDLGRTRAGLGPDGHAQATLELERFLATMDIRHNVAGRVAYRRLVELLWEHGEIAKATAAADRGLRTYPDDHVLVAATANMLAMAGEYDLAREGFMHAQRLAKTERCEFGIASDFAAKIDLALANLPRKKDLRGRMKDKG